MRSESMSPTENKENLSRNNNINKMHQPPSVTLATGGYDRQIRFWSPSDGSCRHHIMFPDSVCPTSDQHLSRRARNLYLKLKTHTHTHTAN